MWEWYREPYLNLDLKDAINYRRFVGDDIKTQKKRMIRDNFSVVFLKMIVLEIPKHYQEKRNGCICFMQNPQDLMANRL